MDKTILIAGVIAIVAILAVTIVLNPFGNTPTDTTKTTKDDSKETSDNSPLKETTSETQETASTENKHSQDNIEYETATYGRMLEDVEGNCTLYQHMGNDKLQCFGLAGNYSTMVTNEYRKAESDTYFCKGTIYGCKLYQKVEFQ